MKNSMKLFIKSVMLVGLSFLLISCISQKKHDLTEECSVIIDAEYQMKKDLLFPDHFYVEGGVAPREGDFDPNEYFQILPHLSIEPGYVLDYLYSFSDYWGGSPIIYARKIDDPPFTNKDEFLHSFYDNEELRALYSDPSEYHYYNYLSKIQVEDSPEGYLEYALFLEFGRHFYLDWHELYYETEILCDDKDAYYAYSIISELERKAGYDLDDYLEIKNRAKQIDYTPFVQIHAEYVLVRYVYFSEYGGFTEVIYRLNREYPSHYTVRNTTLVDYESPIKF